MDEIHIVVGKGAGKMWLVRSFANLREAMRCRGLLQEALLGRLDDWSNPIEGCTQDDIIRDAGRIDPELWHIQWPDDASCVYYEVESCLHVGVDCPVCGH